MNKDIQLYFLVEILAGTIPYRANIFKTQETKTNCSYSFWNC